MVNLYDLEESLRSHALAASGPSHVQAFRSWLLGDDGALHNLVAEAVTGGQQRHPEHVAVLGYAGAAGLLSQTELQTLSDDAEQLAGRSYFPGGRPWRFELDGIALLGVTLGISLLPGSADVQWLVELLERSAREMTSDEWNLGLVNAARLARGNMHLVVQPCDLAVAMATKGIGVLPSDLDDAWTVATSLVRPETADRAAVRLVALRDLVARASQIVPRTATLDDLVSILEGTKRSLKRWPYVSA